MANNKVPADRITSAAYQEWSAGGGHLFEMPIAAVMSPDGARLFTVGATQLCSFSPTTLARLANTTIATGGTFQGASGVAHNQFIRCDNTYLWVMTAHAANLYRIRRYDVTNLASFSDITFTTARSVVGMQIGDGLGGFGDNLYVLLYDTGSTNSFIRQYNMASLADVGGGEANLQIDVVPNPTTQPTFGIDYYRKGAGNDFVLVVGTKSGGIGMVTDVFEWNNSINFFVRSSTILPTGTGDAGLADAFFVIYRQRYSSQDNAWIVQSNDLRVQVSDVSIATSFADRRNLIPAMRMFVGIHGGLLSSNPNDRTRLFAYGIMGPSASNPGSALVKIGILGNPTTTQEWHFQSITGMNDAKCMTMDQNGNLLVYVGSYNVNTTVSEGTGSRNTGGWIKIRP